MLIVSFLPMREARATLLDSRHNVQACEQLAIEIKQMRGLNSVANDHAEGPGMTNAKIIATVRELGMSEAQVRSVQRLMPADVEGTEYQRQDVSLILNSVSMQQVVRFLLKIEKDFSSTKATSLNLSVARNSRRNTQPGERWNAQVTLTQLVYLARSVRP